MRTSIHCSLAVVAAALVLAPAASAADTWYVAPGGGGNDCSIDVPCTATFALETKALDNDTVVFAGGDYPISTGLAPVNWISLEGAKTGVPTRLIGGTGVDETLSFDTAATLASAHITDLRVTNQKDDGVALSAVRSGLAGLVIDRVYAEASGADAVGLFAVQAAATSGLTVRNSIGRVTGAGSAAIELLGPEVGTGSAALNNVVADSRGASGIGLKVRGGAGASTCGVFNVALKNIIARSAAGDNSDINLENGFGAVACDDPSVTSFNSNWRSANTMGISSNSDQHSADPIFVNAAAGDYHQVAGSPTIDAGTNDGGLGPSDLDNQTRVQGSAPDIGAYEFFVPPPPVPVPDTTAPIASKLKLSPKSFLPKPSKQSSVAAKKKKKPKGTTATFTLSEAATVKFTVEKKTNGRKKGKKCSSTSKTGKKCTFYKAVKGSFFQTGKVGANKFTFTGYLNGKALKAGSYRLVGVPTDAAGNAGASFNAAFTILKK